MVSSIRYIKKSIFDIQDIIDILRFILVNAILSLIFIFISMEELDWSIFSYREEIQDTVIDNSSWNINKIF